MTDLDRAVLERLEQMAVPQPRDCLEIEALRRLAAELAQAGAPWPRKAGRDGCFLSARITTHNPGDSAAKSTI